VPGLPSDICVARRTFTCLGQVVQGNDLDRYINVENGFMSTSFFIYPIDETVEAKVCYTIYYVPKGTPCLYLLLRNRVEFEILFPPGTRYLIFERQSINGGWLQYAMIVP
jgi:hypothetical protein